MNTPLLLLGSMVVLPALAAVPLSVAVQGRLANGAGAPVADGKYTLVVSMYDSPGAAVATWKQVLVGADVKEGIFSVSLGDPADAPVDPATFPGPRWVGVAVQGEPELPRTPMASVPFAIRAAMADDAAHAITSDHATSADSSTMATSASGLSCTGCVGAGHIAAGAVESEDLAAGAVTATKIGSDVWAAIAAAYLPIAGGTVTGDLETLGTFSLGKDADFASKPIRGFRFENASAPPVPCDAAHSGYVYFDPAETALLVCAGSQFRRVSLALAGETPQTAATSCLTILQAGAASGDKNYWLDLDGTGVVEPAQYFCDMSGGGWTRVSSQDFTNGAAPWSFTTTTDCGSLGRILGGYGVLSGSTISATVWLGIAIHSQVKVELDYIAVDSSDAEKGFVTVAGTEVWTQTLNNCGTNVSTQYCGNAPPCHGDTVYKVSATTAHSSGTVVVSAGSTLDQLPTDESFGIDNVVVWIR